MRNETTQQLDLPNIFETATNDIIDENEGIKDVEKGTFVAPISNIVKERINGGKFNSLNNFINRVNPKDINKLQLEGLVKSGAFDSINNSRQSIYDSIPKLIQKSSMFSTLVFTKALQLLDTSDLVLRLLKLWLNL